MLDVENRGHLRVLRLNRPSKKNALNGPLIWAITEEFRAAGADDDVWVIALTGNGTGFCSGLDLGGTASSEHDPSVPPPKPEASREYGAHDNMAMVMRVECEKPIVAGVNGVAVGMGVALAMAADIRIAAPSASFHPGYARVGTSPDGGATWTVTEALGYERAMRFFLEQRAVGAEEALHIGLVGEVSATDQGFDQRLIEYGTMLAENAPIAARQTKRLLSRVTQPANLAEHLDDEVRATLWGLSSQDGAIAIQALMSGDRPRFTGR